MTEVKQHRYFTPEDFAKYSKILEELKSHPYNAEIERRIANCPSYSPEELQELKDNADIFSANFFWNVLTEA
jgi:hypothetical protein